MSYLIQQMDQMISQLESMTPQQIRKMPSYQVRLALRKELKEVGFAPATASKMALDAKIEVSQSAFDNHRDLLDRMISVAARSAKMSVRVFSEDFDDLSFSEIIAVMDPINLNLDL